MMMKQVQETPWWQVANIVPMITIIVFAAGVVAQHQTLISDVAKLQEMITNTNKRLDEFIALEQKNRENILELEANQVQAFSVLKMQTPTYSK